MKLLSLSLFFLFLGASLACAAETDRLNYYVQLVRGNNGDTPPPPEARPIGGPLRDKLRPIFKWQNYWEVDRQQIAVLPGRKATVRLGDKRDVLIDLTTPGKRVVTAYADGRLASSVIRPIGDGMTITGGDRDGKNLWFIIVRRDKPSN